MVAVRSLLFALILLFVPLAAFAEEGVLLDQVVAVISPGGRSEQLQLITRSDLELEARVLFVSRGAAAAAEQVFPDDTLGAVLDWLVAELLLQAEAEQLEVAAVDPQAIERELATLRGRFGAGWEDFLATNELVEADLSRIVRRRLVVDGYVASRLRLGMNISEAEVRRAFEARREEFGESGYEWVRPRLRAQLERERREALVAALVADLRERAEVRVVVALGGGEKKAPAGKPWYLPADTSREKVD